MTEEPEESSTSPEQSHSSLLLSSWPQYNKPSRIVTLGHYYPQGQIEETNLLLREQKASYQTSTPDETRVIRQNLGWTKLINAMNEGRQWPIKRLFSVLDPMLQSDIAIAVVPTHIAYQAFWPMRSLAKQLAEHGRIDATSCLVRYTTIRRITFGGPSTRTLHRQTIRVENQHLVSGNRVLLLDDIAKSGTSLLACRAMLYEAGATVVQAMAMGRVIVSTEE